MKFSESDIRSSVKGANFIKGKEYFRYGYVTECIPKTDTDALLIFSSKSRGTYESFYTQTVQMHKTFGSIKLHGVCSCPVGFNCKHVIAACLHYRHTLENNNPKVQLERWVNSLKHSISSSEQEPTATEGNFIIYRLYRYDSPYDQGDVKFYKTKRGKSGKINKGTQIATSNLLHGMNHHEIMSEEDWVIFGLSKKCYDKYGNSVQLKKSSGYLLLQKLIASGRCYLGEGDSPLRLEDTPFLLKFEWMAEDAEHSRLISNLTSDHHLTKTHPLMVINIDENTIQKVENAPDPQTLELLLKAPPLKNDYLIEAYESLHKELPLPAPIGYSIETLEEKPIPRITLQKNGDGMGYMIHLAMMYGHFRFECSASANREYVTENNKRIEIIRDKEAEYQHILTLNG